MADDASTTLYERDFYAWTRSQADALRARRAGENALDYDRLAEEIEDLGKSERNAVASNVQRILEHLYKLAATGREEPRGHWRIEIMNFRDDADRHVTESILRLVDEEMEALHRKAAKIAQASMDLHEPGVSVDAARRWSLRDVLDEDLEPFDLAK